MTKKDIYVPGSGDFCKQIDCCDATIVGNHIFISGQGGVDWSTMKVMPTYDEQVRWTWINVKKVLEACGAEDRHITQIEMFIVHDKTDPVPFMDKVMKIFEIKKEILPNSIPTGSSVGVTALAMPEMLVEIQVEAVIC